MPHRVLTGVSLTAAIITMLGTLSAVVTVRRCPNISETQGSEPKDVARFRKIFDRPALGREHRMIELKRQVNNLTERVVETLPYDLSFVGKR